HVCVPPLCPSLTTENSPLSLHDALPIYKIGRKPIILAGFFLAAVTYYPLYNALGNAANPANINYPLAILIVAIMVSYVGMIATIDRKSTRLNSSHGSISYAVFCLKKKTA